MVKVGVDIVVCIAADIYIYIYIYFLIHLFIYIYSSITFGTICQQVESRSKWTPYNSQQLTAWQSRKSGFDSRVVFWGRMCDKADISALIALEQSIGIESKPFLTHRRCNNNPAAAQTRTFLYRSFSRNESLFSCSEWEVPNRKDELHVTPPV